MSNTTLILSILILTMFFYQDTVTEQQTVHAEGNQYTCDVCKRSFALRRAFRRHWLTHRLESQYSCNVCDKSFYDRSSLRRHQRLHTGERPFSRRVCNKSYSNQSDLKQQHQHVHGEV
jgi:uncharacterized Zn-finger protein